METALAAVRWLGLIGALLLTLVVLKEVFLVLRALGHIETLAGRIRDAARAMAGHVRHADRIGALGEPLTELGEGAADLRVGASRVRERIGSLAQASSATGRPTPPEDRRGAGEQGR